VVNEFPVIGRRKIRRPAPPHGWGPQSFGALTRPETFRFEVAPGEVHALIGRTEAGKSTLMKISAALTCPDGGRIVADADRSFPKTRCTPAGSGIEMIYQELTSRRT